MPRFRAEDADGRGAGGKALHPLRPVAATPYLRSPTPPDRPEQRGWLSGLVSGAGRLLSAVFASSSSETSDSSCSCSCSDYDSCKYSDDEEYGYASDTEGGLDQPGKKMELVEDQTMDHPPLASIGSSKLLIEQLICQETFTRNECNTLVEMVRSRVADSPKVDDNCAPPYDKLLSRTACSNVASPKAMGLGWSFESHWKSPVTDGHVHTVSPRYFSDQGHSPEFCDQAVMEAKKWVQEKRSVSNFVVDLGCGPCTLNTEMYQYDSDGDRGSPVARAKSYMHVLPPWRSPRMMTAGFSTTSRESFLEKYEYLDSVSPKISSLRPTHGEPPSRGQWDTLNITQSWWQHLRKSVSLPPLSRHSDFSDGKLDNGYFPTMSCTNRLKPEVLHSDSCIAPDNNLLDVPKKLSMDAPKYGSSGAENALKKKPFLDNGLVRDLGTSDSDHVETSREISNVKGVEASRLTEEKVGSTANVAHNDAALVDTSYVLDTEPISMVHENSKVFFSSSPNEDADQIINGGIASSARSSGPERISVQIEAVGTSYDDTQGTHGEAAGIVGRSTQNGLSLRSLRPSGEPSASASDAHGSDNDANKPHNGTTVMSIKKMLRDKPPNLVYIREKKAAAKSWRGRGRGRGGRKAT